MIVLEKFVAFLRKLLGETGNVESPIFDSLNGVLPYHPVVRWEQAKDGKTTLTLDADHLVLDGNRIDIAPADSPRRLREPFFKHSLPRELGGRSLQPSIPRVERIRHKRRFLQQTRDYLARKEQLRLKEQAHAKFDSMWLNE